MQPGAIPEHVPLSGQATPVVIRDGITVLQLNVEGLTKAKITIIEHILQTHKVTAILLQETHVSDSSRLKIPGFTLAACTESDIHGIATFIKNTAKWKQIDTSPPDSTIEWSATQTEGVNIINVYKPPSSRLQADSIPAFDSPCIYAGDFTAAAPPGDTHHPIQMMLNY